MFAGNTAFYRGFLGWKVIEAIFPSLERDEIMREGRLALAEFPSIQLRNTRNVDLADLISSNASGREI